MESNNGVNLLCDEQVAEIRLALMNHREKIQSLQDPRAIARTDSERLKDINAILDYLDYEFAEYPCVLILPEHGMKINFLDFSLASGE